MSTIDDNNDQCGGGEEISNIKECTSCEQNNINSVTEEFNNVAILDDTSTCANCGKKGSIDNMNTCNKCKEVKYCNAACKKKHRTKHKKACERKVAELHEEQLFKEPPPRPICMLPFPMNSGQSVFKSCCGKSICIGCVVVMRMSEGKDICAFCRKPPALRSEKEVIERTKNLMDKGNAESFNMLAGCYLRGGEMGIQQDYQKARELYLKAGELGHADGYCNLGNSYNTGRGLEIDKKKAKHYYELAAMMGDAEARHNLGCMEFEDGNVDRAMKHFVMAARAGHVGSLDAVKQMFMQGGITKDVYASTLRVYHERQNEMKSDERDKASQILAEMRRSGFRW